MYIVNVHARCSYESNSDEGADAEFGRHVCAVNANERKTAPRRYGRAGGAGRENGRGLSAAAALGRLSGNYRNAAVSPVPRSRRKILLRTHADRLAAFHPYDRSGGRHSAGKNKNPCERGRANENRRGEGRCKYLYLSYAYRIINEHDIMT